MNHDNISLDDDLDDDSPTDDDLVADLIDLETQKRLWLRTHPALATSIPRQ